MWRFRFTLNFLLFCAVLWTSATIWAGYLIGRNIDYWITKADNQVMRTKMAYLASEMDRSRDLVAKAVDTDRQMRSLLGMHSRRRIIQTDEGMGGPEAGERLGLLQSLTADPVRLSPAVIRSNALALRRQSQQRLASFRDIGWYISTNRSLYRSTPSGWPAEGRITSGFGYRFSPMGGHDDGDVESSEFHSGVDIANRADTPVLATADGIVRRTGWYGGYGKVVLIEHQWGFSTLYGHTSKVEVREGEAVRRGQLIAYMGTTGRSTGDHVHYEVWRHGKPVNPIQYLRGSERTDDDE